MTESAKLEPFMCHKCGSAAKQGGMKLPAHPESGKCTKCDTWWWLIPCWVHGIIDAVHYSAHYIDERQNPERCEHCGRFICPTCGKCAEGDKCPRVGGELVCYE